MSKLKILFCIDDLLNDAGTEKQFIEIVRRINKSKFETHVCCVRESLALEELSRRAPCHTLVLPLERIFSFKGFLRIRALRRYIDSNKIDIVHTFMVKANALGVMAASRSSCRTIIASRRNLGYWFTPRTKMLFRYINARTTRFLANSEGAKRAAVEFEKVSPDKVDVIYSGVDIARFSPDRGNPEIPRKLGIPDNVPLVGIVANLRPVKNLQLFLDAAKLVAERVPRAAFLIVGRGPLLGELHSRARHLGIGERVFFANGYGEVPDYLRRMCVACLTSQSEGFSSSILEYMAAGLPVVATDVGGNREAIADGVNGFLVNSGDAEACAARVAELLADEALRKKMSEQSFCRCRQLFQIDAAVRRHEEYYKWLIQSEKDAPNAPAENILTVGGN